MVSFKMYVNLSVQSMLLAASVSMLLAASVSMLLAASVSM